ncbi:MAG: T9SS type A sorting domain-containing protein [candidate division KSB1 bacterium]|nr:T9SS type A sorting domain-containing protein [candidate division KSB1 bacterium]
MFTLKSRLYIFFLISIFLISSLHATPAWWDNPDGASSHHQSIFTGHLENTGDQGINAEAILDVPNLAIPANTKDIWMQVEWEVTRGSGNLLTGVSAHTIEWTYDGCPADPLEDLTNIVDADFMDYEGTFSPEHEVETGNTFDNGTEFSYQIVGQPGCERIYLKFSISADSKINYYVDVQTICWGQLECSGGCPPGGSQVGPGNQDVNILEFTLDTGDGGDGWWESVTLCRAPGVDDANIDAVEIQTSGGISIGGPVAWSPGDYIYETTEDGIFRGQTIDITDQLIEETSQTFKVLVDISSGAEAGDEIGLQIYSVNEITVTDPATKSSTGFPILCDEPIAISLSSFHAKFENQSTVLRWRSESEINHAGYNIHRSMYQNGPFSKINSQLVTECQSVNNGVKYYKYCDPDAIAGTLYYKLEDVSLDGQSTFHGPVAVNVTSDVNNTSALPRENRLHKVFPNPFNPSTTIRYELANSEMVHLQVYDLNGRLVQSITEGMQPPGQYQSQWNGVNESGQSVSSGVYLLILRAGSQTFQQKMTLLR